MPVVGTKTSCCQESAHLTTAHQEWAAVAPLLARECTRLQVPPSTARAKLRTALMRENCEAFRTDLQTKWDTNRKEIECNKIFNSNNNNNYYYYYKKPQWQQEHTLNSPFDFHSSFLWTEHKENVTMNHSSKQPFSNCFVTFYNNKICTFLCIRFWALRFVGFPSFYRKIPENKCLKLACIYSFPIIFPSEWDAMKPADLHCGSRTRRCNTAADTQDPESLPSL
jgi:hypothetical protein